MSNWKRPSVSERAKEIVDYIIEKDLNLSMDEALKYAKGRSFRHNNSASFYGEKMIRKYYGESEYYRKRFINDGMGSRESV